MFLGHAYQLSPYNQASPTIFDQGTTLAERERERERETALFVKKVYDSK